MFEKEAEERAKQFMKTHSESDKFINCKRETDNYNVILAQGYELGFQKGAEFGYNKGFEFGVKSNEKVNQIVDNEWHYVKDGDLPKGEGAVLIYWKCGDIKCVSVVEPYKVTEDTHIIAWKEIVLPELKESE